MNKIKRNMLIIIAILFITLVSIYGFSYAKYAIDRGWNYYLNSKGFYFSSNQLDTEEVENVNNAWTGGDIHFNIRNNKNESLISEMDINYKVECEIQGELADELNCSINNSNQSIYKGVLSKTESCINQTEDLVDTREYNQTACEISGYTWTNQVAESDIHFNIINNNNIDYNDIQVKIKVTTEQPYKKTIKGEFALHKVENKDELINKNFKDYENYSRLTISSSYLSNKCLNLSWDSDKYRIDTKNMGEIISDTNQNGYINGINISIHSMENKSFIFYKQDPLFTYSVNEFIINEIEC